MNRLLKKMNRLLTRIIHETEKRVKKINFFDLIKILGGAGMQNKDFSQSIQFCMAGHHQNHAC